MTGTRKAFFRYFELDPDGPKRFGRPLYQAGFGGFEMGFLVGKLHQSAHQLRPVR